METIYSDEKGNRIIGCAPKIDQSAVSFNGENNLLYCEKNVRLTKSELIFHGNESLVYLGEAEHKLRLDIFHNSVAHFGRNNSYTERMHLALSEQKHFFMGDGGIVAFGVFVRNSDPHLIYDCESGKRINPTKSVYIGDHVWLGQNTCILKGTRIDSGSIVGANSVITGKSIGHNSIWAGNPAKKIKDNIFWDATCVHAFDEQMTEMSMHFSELECIAAGKVPQDVWKYYYDKGDVVEWNYLEKNLSRGTALAKCDFLVMFNSIKRKNRFVHK